MLTIICYDRMVEKKSSRSPADCALLVGATAGGAVAAAAPAGWQILELAAGPAVAQSASAGGQPAGSRHIRRPVASLHAVLQAVVASHFPGKAIPDAVGSLRDKAESPGQVIPDMVGSLRTKARARGQITPDTVSRLRDEAGGPAQLVVGHAMKLSREAALAQRGMLPLLPADGVCFLPLRLDLPLASQGPFHVVLHKVLPATPRARSRPPCRVTEALATLSVIHEDTHRCRRVCNSMVRNRCTPAVHDAHHHLCTTWCQHSHCHAGHR